MAQPVSFKSSYFLRMLKSDLNPFTPNMLIIDEDYIEFRRKNWHLISSDSETLHFKNITGITVDSHLLGTTITIKSTGNDPILVNGFWKKEANEIKALCSKYINLYNQKHTGQSNYTNQAGVGGYSVADELAKLKNLLEQGILTQAEFDEQKQKLLQR